jgi:hypothetical protein
MARIQQHWGSSHTKSEEDVIKGLSLIEHNEMGLALPAIAAAKSIDGKASARKLCDLMDEMALRSAGESKDFDITG